ncbi:hypothetical protein [Baekduia sp.]|uniref:hypothetical protein n=1 Tax=Baekduia sp. TaxID=2600305 RepID=UPI002E0C4547|nr:hypothetical protein [Baekduia sp.]
MDARTVRRRRLTALGAVALLAVAGGAVAGAGGGGSSGESAGATSTPAAADTPRPAQLPGGGRRLFPDRRVVAFYGNPRDDELGALGIGTPAQAAKRLLKQAKPYNLKARPVLPAMELISTVATAAPGDAGLYRDHISFAKIRSYLAAARKIHALLILDIQPGRGEFGPEITRLAPFLREPDVGLALDPEWHVGPDALPGKVIGSTDADVVNAAATYLSKIVRERDLPEKLLIVHRFTDDMIARADRLRQVPGVQTVVNVDGFGSTSVKVAKYHSFVHTTPQMRRGFKLFYKEDVKTMSPKSVMALSPRPDVVVYE